MPNRTICNVLEEMRQCHETRNFSYLLGLIEEAQSMANRMEAALYDQSDLDRARRDCQDWRENARLARDDFEAVSEGLAELERKVAAEANILRAAKPAQEE